MSRLVDQRDVIVRAEDAARAAEFELVYGIDLRRCECGATDLVADATGTFCAGCGAEMAFYDFSPVARGEAARSVDGASRGDRGGRRLPLGLLRSHNFWLAASALSVPVAWSVAVLVAVWVLR